MILYDAGGVLLARPSSLFILPEETDVLRKKTKKEEYIYNFNIYMSPPMPDAYSMGRTDGCGTAEKVVNFGFMSYSNRMYAPRLPN